MFTKDIKIAVIGSGIAGLAAAIRLASQGFAVDLFEKNAAPGGKMSEIREKGFRFDTGPSLFTMPQWLEELFSDAGHSLKEYMSYHKLDNVCRYFFADGSIINAYSDPHKFAAELEYKAGENPENIFRYLTKSERIFNITNPVFLQKSIHIPRNYLRKDFLRAYLSLPAIRPFEKLNRVNRMSFNDPRIIQLFDRFATYNGSNPYKTPATMMVIPHLEHNIGAFFPEGGIYHIADSVTRLAEDIGVNLHYNAKVNRIIEEGKRVRGLKVNGEVMEYDVVVSDVDIHYVYKELLGRKALPGVWFNHERSTSALIFYWGMGTSSPGLDVHNILFSRDYPTEFHHLFNLKTIYKDPTVYIFISSKFVRDDAPDGKENWFVMINTPENRGQDWDELIKAARESIKEKIRTMTGIHPDSFIEFERILDPRSIERNTASFGGSLYGNSSNSLWAAFRRHPNFMPGIKGLYFVGGSVHPGGGIPLCLSSAKIVSELIINKKR
jgi:phytoene desaturase